jgi:Cysteine-rich CPCC
MLLYRPLGLHELRLVAAAGWRAWPPRLPHQPIFYPVLTFDYARAIARDWNPKDASSAFLGLVSRFKVTDNFAARYPKRLAGGASHEELWVPAADLPEFNDHIRGFIEIIEAFPGPGFDGTLDPVTHLPAGLSPPRASGALKFGCPCCRCLTLSTRAGFECCPVCFWEDDGQDEPDADEVRGGPNGTLSLSCARENFASFGACDRASEAHVRAALPAEL